ncbi:hypothetical protein STRATTON_113 [Erwinia phage vB_EamM_Stratton]|uniref:Uncharacterized protein n=1 Tax=Erwinia phage vB_EamM_Stratton TaxID=1883378 RepID=A0A1B2IH02_9CAUD|nr:hypothetical protein STRATTON_113 [Erwinia phage vB_EamM_Stratton]
MSTLELDFAVLTDDWERLVALESIGVGLDNPAVQAICRRWCITDEELLVARESREMMERAQVVSDTAANPRLIEKVIIGGAHQAGRLAEKGIRKGAKAGARGVAKVSKNLLSRFNAFAEDLAKEQIEYMKHAVSKATKLEKGMQHLALDLKEHKSLDIHPIETGRWTSKVCIEDKVDVHGCISFISRGSSLEGAVQEYVVKTRGILESKKVTETGSLDKFGRSTNWAIKRSAGIMGIVNPFKKVSARPLAGNVVLVEHHNGAIQYAVANDGDYADHIPSLSHADCEAALKAVHQIVGLLRERGVKRKAVGYTGISEEVNHMRRELKGAEGKDMIALTKAYKSAMALEDSFTTALVRVGEGLLEYVKRSLKGQGSNESHSDNKA